MRNASLLVLMALTVAGEATAQHPVSPTAPTLQDGCDICHGTHRADAGAYSLKGGAERGMWQQLTHAQAPGLSGVSQSCLRCHGTPELRAREPEYSGRPAAAIGSGAYLGLDLSDDHRLGSIEDSEGLPRFGRTAAPRSVPGSLRIGRWIPEGEASHIECTTCHDPHRRDIGPLSSAELQVVCGNCHDPATYTLPGHADQPCTDCHRMHGGAETNLLAEHDTDALCTECHGAPAGGPAPPMDAHLTTGSRASFRSSPGELNTCTDCHIVHR